MPSSAFCIKEGDEYGSHYKSDEYGEDSEGEGDKDGDKAASSSLIESVNTHSQEKEGHEEAEGEQGI